MALQRLMDDCEVAHTLIIAPLRVARKVWTDEIDQWEHIRQFDVQKILGSEQQRLKAMNTKAEIHIINRENVTWLVNQFVQNRKLIRRWHWDNVIIDESSSFSYQSSQRWKSLRLMRKKIDRMVQLTGTPDTRNLRGLWAQMYLLDYGKRLGFSEKEFNYKFFIPPSRYDTSNKFIPKHNAQKRIRKRLKDIVMSLRAKDFLELPEVSYIYHRIDLSDREMDVYGEMERQYLIHYGEDIIKAVNSGVLANKLLQLANGFIYAEDRKWHPFHERKTEMLLEIVEGVQSPCMVAYNYIPDRIRIEKALTDAKINWRLLKTEQDEEDWNAGKIDVLVLSPKSAGHGLNLHKSGANALVWYGLIWSLEQYLQCCARLTGGHRAVGRQIVVHHIVAQDTYEDRVRYTLSRNAKNQEEMMDGLRDYIKRKKDA
jgi:SNF2 family DNA or RNA helicase